MSPVIRLVQTVLSYTSFTLKCQIFHHAQWYLRSVLCISFCEHMAPSIQVRTSIKQSLVNPSSPSLLISIVQLARKIHTHFDDVRSKNIPYMVARRSPFSLYLEKTKCEAIWNTGGQKRSASRSKINVEIPNSTFQATWGIAELLVTVCWHRRAAV